MNTNIEKIPSENNYIIKYNNSHIVEKMDWGSLTWFASEKIGNSKNATLGYCKINVGYSNYKHYHTNCEEILYVLEGKIVHMVDNTEVNMQEGDSITIPPNIFHSAKNVGNIDAVLLIYFSSPNRLTVSE